MEYITDQKSESRGHNSDPRSLPCLNSNISTEIPSEALQNSTESVEGAGDQVTAKPTIPRLSTQHRKSAFILKESVQQLSDRYGLEKLGFLTLTFREHICDPKEAQKRLNSLISHVIKPRYHEYLGVFERQKSGRIHYHLLVALDIDIRTGFDFEGIQNRNYSSASKKLREEWAFWRKTAPKYGFGRTELLPIKSNTAAIAKYVGKYISKHMEVRNEEDKGIRLVRYSRGARAGTTRFQFQSKGSQQWREATAIFAQIVQNKFPDQKVNELSDLTRVMGKRWAYNHREYILAISDFITENPNANLKVFN